MGCEQPTDEDDPQSYCEHDSYTMTEKEETVTGAGVTILYRYAKCDLCGKKVAEKYEYLGAEEVD